MLLIALCFFFMSYIILLLVYLNFSFILICLLKMFKYYLFIFLLKIVVLIVIFSKHFFKILIKYYNLLGVENLYMGDYP